MDLAGENQLEPLVARLCTIVSASGGVACGVIVNDDERDLAHILYSAVDAPGACARESVSQRLPELRDVAGAVDRDLQSWRPLPFLAELHRRGARRFDAFPLTIAERAFGSFFVVTATGQPLADEERSFYSRLAVLAAPIAWNCVSTERFSRGDRRRDSLIELMRSLNTTLRPEAVIDSACKALRGLEAHASSAIMLIEPDGRHFRNYRLADDVESGAAEMHAVDGSAVERIAQLGATYQSDDLRAARAFAHDERLLADGVRRYVATPLQARSRLLGALLIASTDPHPARRIDLWLFDNIAIQLGLAIDNAVQHEQVRQLSDKLRQQNVYLREEIQSEHDFGEMIGESPAMRRLHESVSRVAATPAIVLVTGETGAGKELVARAIHAASPRCHQPMVKVNCAAIPEGTVESELFGHERGAFTSAVERRIGRFELASDGTLFLDEIGELPAAVQAKLLRVLQDGDFERVGGSRTLHTHARVIAATNRNLLAACDAGTFRRDLYYRLNVFPIHVPSLSERREDIPLLVQAFVGQFSRRMGKRVESIAPESLASLMERDWPGNIRELKHVIERAMILCDGTVLAVEDAPRRTPAASPVAMYAPRVETATAAPFLLPAAAPAGISDLSLNSVQAEHIRRVLIQTRWRIDGPRGAARILGLKPSTLRFRMKRLGIER
ncbi:Formate hydrogenlyase transcriptional activator [Phycisphaerae bacterium RAS1]|nr:Formate hydrogenlyase transcriptional activator [Phycisphaerae bacterium RAS1]